MSDRQPSNVHAGRWKLVPVDPTNEQMEAMQDHDYEASIYWAAIAAAPRPLIPVNLRTRVESMRASAETEKCQSIRELMDDVLVLLELLEVPQ